MTLPSTNSPHTGQHLLNQQVTFPLRYSDQASTFNAGRHDDLMTGPVLLAYDEYVVVRVAGWRFAHTVPADKCEIAGGAA